jgi:hypothetical protein
MAIFNSYVSLPEDRINIVKLIAIKRGKLGNPRGLFIEVGCWWEHLIEVSQGIFIGFSGLITRG